MWLFIIVLFAGADLIDWILRNLDVEGQSKFNNLKIASFKKYYNFSCLDQPSLEFCLSKKDCNVLS